MKPNAKRRKPKKKNQKNQKKKNQEEETQVEAAAHLAVKCRQPKSAAPCQRLRWFEKKNKTAEKVTKICVSTDWNRKRNTVNLTRTTTKKNAFFRRPLRNFLDTRDAV